MTNERSSVLGRATAAGALVLTIALLLSTSAWAQPKQEHPVRGTAQTHSMGPEARLIEIYRLISQGQSRPALILAERLVKDQPHFQLAQLVYADLLLARSSAWRKLSQPPRPPQLPQPRHWLTYGKNQRCASKPCANARRRVIYPLSSCACPDAAVTLSR